MTEYPRRLVEVVRNELREFSADDPEASDLLDQDAVRILGRLADAGVEFPADPEPRWSVVAEGDGVRLRHPEHPAETLLRSEFDPWAAVLLAEHIAEHLNGECTVRFDTLVGLVRGYLVDKHNSDSLVWCSRFADALGALDAVDAAKETD